MHSKRMKRQCLSLCLCHCRQGIQQLALFSIIFLVLPLQSWSFGQTEIDTPCGNSLSEQDNTYSPSRLLEGILLAMKKLLTSIIIGSSLLLGACGQTGPLFLPDQPDKTVDGR